jgi:hypothetical protein
LGEWQLSSDRCELYLSWLEIRFGGSRGVTHVDNED